MGKSRKKYIGAEDMMTPVEITRHLGKRMRTLRTDRELRLHEIADRMSTNGPITVAMLSRYELGKANMTASRLYEIACALKVAPGELFEGLPSIRGT